MVLSRRKDQLLMYLNVENMTDINEDLVHKLFDKKSPISGGAIKNCVKPSIRRTTAQANH